MKVNETLGRPLTSILHARQVIDGKTTKSITKWKSKGKKVARIITVQRKLLGR